MMNKPRTKVEAGLVFGRLTVQSIERLNHVTFCYCICTCGVVKRFRYATSCGCLRRDIGNPTRRKNHTASRASWNYYKRNARIRNIEWKLNWEEFQNLVLNPCHYCGLIFSRFVKRPSGEIEKLNGVDRLHNHLGYTSENSVSCCKFCNFAKNDSKLEDFLIWLNGVRYGHISNK